MRERDKLEDEGKRPAIPLTLNLDAVIAPAQNAVVLSSEIVDFLFEAIGKTDLSEKPANAATQYKFKTPEISAADRKAMFENWMFSKALQDLMRGIRASLEQAYFFLELLTKPQKTKSDTTLDEFFAPFKRKAATFNFADLLDAVNSKLPSQLNFIEAYHSLQRARNCLEHRNGIVGQIDVNANGEMELRFPRVKNFYIRQGQEIELEPGHIVDAQDDKNEVQIFARIELRERRFAKSQRLVISITDFNEIAFACNYFVHDLAAKIAAVPVTAASK